MSSWMTAMKVELNSGRLASTDPLIRSGGGVGTLLGRESARHPTPAQMAKRKRYAELASQAERTKKLGGVTGWYLEKGSPNSWPRMATAAPSLPQHGVNSPPLHA
ncbi:hypothetical protein XENOCAPTIV_003499 [Xenoophorus captivus]|uniref:Uncharacterized protein n=1 Tax=Xenoophorus captivus TaxID=1517983 RepID=A0ABV0S605_9TELE